MKKDYTNFAQSRLNLNEPDDQAQIPHPRIGFYGVIDERFKLALLENIAELRPEFQYVLIGPVINISSSKLPTKQNIHYLGAKNYDALPTYIAGWDCSMLLYEQTEKGQESNAERAMEFLAAGKPIVSTSLGEVIHPYADAKFVYIADHPEQFIECIEKAMNERAYDPEWLERVDHFLENKINENYPMPAYLDSSLMAIGIV